MSKYPLMVKRTYDWYGKGPQEYEMKAGNRDVKEALGLSPTKHLPDEGATGELNGVKIVVLPKGKTVKNGKVVEARSRIARRTFAECPSCKKLVCAGHLDQHVCKTSRKR